MAKLSSYQKLKARAENAERQLRLLKVVVYENDQIELIKVKMEVKLERDSADMLMFGTAGHVTEKPRLGDGIFGVISVPAPKPNIIKTEI